ncbi:phage holin family protein [Nocardioides sp. 616]|uniref:phage holin family protein n=1 Tax=Nocardioides sp. 616 TaxID=2268090 RepID=UPI000CE3DA55|nr:phage holin family protein [Nocardioides sp. 616]
MSAPQTPPPAGPGPGGNHDEPTVGGLVHDLTQQVPDLIRSELRLAQAEMTEKGKRAGLGIGMFSAAGLLAFFGLAAVITACIAALALVLPTWASALIVAAVLFAAAAGVGLAGKSKVSAATPVKPEKAMEGIKEDIDTVKGGHHRV